MKSLRRLLARAQRSEILSPAALALGYAVFSALWILLSDQVVSALVTDPGLRVSVGTLKGWAFVLVTSVFLYGLLYGLVAKVEARDKADADLRDRALRHSQNLLARFVDQAPASLAMFDRGMCYLAASRRWMEDFGLGDDDIVGRSHYDIFPDIPERWRMVHRRALDGEILNADDDRFERGDGTVQWVRWEVRPWYADEGEIGGIMIFTEDITARKQVESELRIAATAFESRQAMVITDRRGKILRVNQAFQQVTGYSAAEVIGQTPAILKSGRQDDDFYKRLWASLRTSLSWHGEIWNRRKTGEIYPEDLSIAAVVDSNGEVTHYVGSFSDISGHKAAQKTIHRLSYYDPLTGLPNRSLLLDRMQEALAAGKPKSFGGVVLVNLDRFGLLNDTRSRRAGDLTLIEAAKRISASIPAEATAARLGGDEFAILIPSFQTDELEVAIRRAKDLSDRIRTVIRQPVAVDSQAHFLTACSGIALYQSGDTTIDEVMKQASASMYQAKLLGPDRSHFFDVAAQCSLEQQVSMESLLRGATREQFDLDYQPQVDQHGDITGVEALIRWRHPDKGIIMPGEFIALAEDTGLIEQIGRWVLEIACRQLKAWEDDAATRHLSIAVNVSAKQFAQPEFVRQVEEAVKAADADPRRLELELTESVLLDEAGATEKMTALKQQGIGFALDDFGTGFSSLAYLRSLPLDKIKIDQSFVRDLHRNENDAAIARTIIALGHSLGLGVIAEGVESEEQRKFLAIHGCTAYQGFLFGKPASCDEVAMVARRGSRQLETTSSV